MDSTQRVDEKKWGRLSSYSVYSRSYGDQNVKNDSRFVFAADTS